ncbi:MAG TPA: ABC transporter ATP-binding protein [Candidatus Atribacteria bacterium]|nr:ABC transporter ATP-binding protein [Candidatus Atribacteria bacterium]
MSKLRIVNLTKRFNEVLAVDNISLEVADGEFVTLLGPSGCGKTTTLRAIAGFCNPDGGEIFFGDKIMNNIPPNKRNTAMCFQSYALFPHMSVWDNISFGLKMKKIPQKEQKNKILKIMKMLGIENLEKRKPGQLSGGQQQRVALARAIVTEPQILLFDEPLSNLDAKLRVQVRVEIREMQKRLGITSLYVTHDQDEALAISDRIVVMNRGHIEQLGDPYTIYRTPETSFVAGFIGLANIYEGTIVKRDRNRYIVEAPFGKITITSKNQKLPEASKTMKFVWRPEDMKIYTPGAPNRVKGQVLQAVFMGNITDIFMEVQGNKIRAQTDESRRFVTGDIIEFSIPEDVFSILRR